MDMVLFHLMSTIDRVTDRCGFHALSGGWTRVIEHNGDVEFSIVDAEGLAHLVEFRYAELNGEDAEDVVRDRFNEFEDTIVEYYADTVNSVRRGKGN